jgi:outer membrane protein assembly factor BamB
MHRIELAAALSIALLAGCTSAVPANTCMSDRECNAGSFCFDAHCSAAPPARATAPAAVALDAQLAAVAPFDPAFMGGPKHRGRSSARIHDDAMPKVVLETGGRLRAAPVIDGAGVVYSASADGKLYRVQDGAGRMLFDSGSRLRATPALAADGTIYVGSEAGTLFALAPDGNVRWQRALDAPIVADLTRTPDGLLLVAADGVYAFEASGALLWHYVLPEVVRSSPCVHPAGFVVFGTAQGAIVALELDGRVRWRSNGHAAIDAAPAIADDGTIVIGNQLGEVLGLRPDGTQRFGFATGGEVHATAAIAASGLILIGSDDGVLYALGSDGALRWRASTSGAIRASARIDAAGRVAIGSRDDVLRVFTADGALLHGYNLGQDIDGAAALAADGTVYIGTDRGALYALR